MAVAKFRDHLDLRAFLANDVFTDDTEIGNGVLYVLRNIIVTQGKNVEIKIPAGGIETLFLKFELQSACTEEGERIIRQASALLDGDF